MSHTLKACPFCGGAAVIADYSERKDGTLMIVECGNADCDCQVRSIPAHQNSIEYAIAAWNRRVPDADLVAALEASIPQMEYKLNHAQTRQGRVNANRVIEQAREALRRAKETNG